MKDEFDLFTVKVGKGSGCLIQPLNNTYSYVLTSKHVVENRDFYITRQYYDESKEDENIKIIEKPYFHNNPEIDVAILKVEKVEGIENLYRADLKTEEKENWFLCGYPDSRAKDELKFRKNELKIENQSKKYFEGELIKNITHSEVKGQSGGGIIKSDNSIFLLAGIQIKMAAEDEKESLSRITFAPLKLFDEIIKQNPNDLSSIVPPYFYNFLILLDEIFPLEELVLLNRKDELLKNQLKCIAESLCNSFSNKALLEPCIKSTLAYNLSETYIYHKQLWIAFLELITINQLHSSDRDLTIHDLKEIRKKHKLIFLDCDNWTKKLEIILKSDLTNLERNGTVIVSCTLNTKPTKTEINGKHLRDISTVPLEQMSIHNTVTDLAEHLKFKHIYHFQEYLIKNSDSFENINPTNVIETIRNETKGII